MSSSSAPVSDTNLVKTAYLTANLSQNAATYDLGTVSGGDILILNVQPYCSVAGAGFTTVAIQSNDTTISTILAALVAASVTAGKNLGLFTSSFVLPSAKKLQYTIVGTGSGGTLKVAIQYMALNSGAVIS